MSRTIFLLLVLLISACEGGAGEGTVSFDRLCPGTLIGEGDPCEVHPDSRCFSDMADCDRAQICVCRNGAFECEDPDWSAACAGLQNAACGIEGGLGCQSNPIAGQRFCEQGVWQQLDYCSPGCPILSDAVLPLTGDACSVAAGEVCEYSEATCECIGGSFECISQ